jgi:Rad3-related DNA helicase
MSLSMLEGYTPQDFGLDLVEYPTFRTDPLNGQEVQLEAIEFMTYCDRWVAAGRIPTGIGKMLIAYCVHKITGLRTVVLTGTKGLQDQYDQKLGKYGACDIRGKTNYKCADFNNLNCRGGFSMGCRYTMGRGCDYEQAKDAAKNEQFIVTNYKYWMTVNDRANGLERAGEDAEFNGKNPVELLILDEAHSAAQQLSDYLGFQFTEEDIKNYVDPRTMGDSLKDWQSLAGDAAEELKAEIRTTGMELSHLGQKATHGQVRVLHNLEERLQGFERIHGMGDDWVIDAQLGTQIRGTHWQGRKWTFDVVWPGRYNHYLFCGVPKVIEMSATLNRKDLGLQGLGQDKYEFREWRRIFPVANCPIYFCPARNEEDKPIRITQKSSEQDKRAWVRHMDEMIQTRLDRRIVIITSSYKYQEYIMQHSRYGPYMMGNKSDGEGGTAMDKFEEFIAKAPPVILCSPSFGTGWDFSFDRCEFLILSKVPLRVPGGASKVMAARLERDPEYGDNETMRDVVQVAGRPQRDMEDYGEVVIADGSWSWFGYRNQHLAPTNFVKDIRTIIGKLPNPPKSIAARNKRG